MNIFTFLLLVWSPIDVARHYSDENNCAAVIQCLEKYTPKPHERADYFMLMASSYFRLNDKAGAIEWAKKIDSSFEKIPQRHRVIANIILYDTNEWNQDDLGDISRDMRHSADRLKNANPVKKIIEIQNGIVNKLDKLIKEKEDAANGANEAKDAENQAKLQGRSNKPLDDSSNVPPVVGKGDVNEITIKHYQDNWARMPEKDRARAIQELTRDLSPRYRLINEEYFKSLNK